MTVQTQAVLHALLADPTEELYGLEISERTGLLPGTTYPILVRLQRVGWIRDRWENIDPHGERRPRRRYYQLTEHGVHAARAALRTAPTGLPAAIRRWSLNVGGSST